jgi:hypothetical protein
MMKNGQKKVEKKSSGQKNDGGAAGSRKKISQSTYVIYI